MAEFIIKNGKYYRNNSDGTQTQVQYSKDGYFYWTQSDGHRVRSAKKYKVPKNTQSKPKPKQEESFWSKVGRVFTNLMMTSAMAENPAAQTASGYYRDDNGKWHHDPDRKEARDLSKVLFLEGLAGLTAYGGGAALPFLLPGTVGGNVIGTVAGGTALGMSLDMGQKAIFGTSLGDKISQSLQKIGIPEPVADLSRPEYWMSPTGKYTTALWNKGAKLVSNFFDRFTPYGFNYGNRFYKVDSNTLSTSFPLINGKKVTNPKYNRKSTNPFKIESYPFKRDWDPINTEFLYKLVEKNGVTDYPRVFPDLFARSEKGSQFGRIIDDNSFGLTYSTVIPKDISGDAFYRLGRYITKKKIGQSSDNTFRKLGVWGKNSDPVSDGRAFIYDMRTAMVKDCSGEVGNVTPTVEQFEKFIDSCDMADLTGYMNMVHGGDYANIINSQISGFKKVRNKNGLYTFEFDKTKGNEEAIRENWKQALLSLKNGAKILPRKVR